METRPVVTSVLALTALLAIAAAPRLLPVAFASNTPEPPVVEVTTEAPDTSTSWVDSSELDGRDAVAEAPAADLVEAPPKVAPKADPAPISRDIDLVIALDTSGSMEGLLDSTRARLWDIVNAAAEKDPNARIRVGLVTFGSPGVAGPEQGFVKVRSDLTTDLDSLYGKVMALQTDGGEEFVGWTLDTAVNQLSWSTRKGAAKIVFIAGNESADQAREQHDFRTVTANARERGIVVNALFAGNADQGVRERWADVAKHGGGFYTAIDQQAGTHDIATPQDQKLVELNAKLNGTYVGYGARGEEGKANQVAQDANAMRMGGSSAAARVGVKSRAAYDNSSWDLVDGVQNGRVDLAAAPATALPEPMRDLDAEGRQAYVEKLAEEREQIQEEIDSLNEERTRYLRKAKPKKADAGLDDAMLEAMDAQL